MIRVYQVPPPCMCCGRAIRHSAFRYCDFDCRIEWLITLSLWPTWAPVLVGRT